MVLLFACADDSATKDSALTGSDPVDSETTDSAPTDSGETAETGTGLETDSGDTDPGETDSGDPPDTDGTATGSAARTLVGELSWDVDFGAEAEAAGQVDCSYHRSFTLTEVNDVAWLCPDCAMMAAGDVVIDDGYDCYQAVGGTLGEAATDILGVGGLGGHVDFYRAGLMYYSLSAYDGADVDSDGVSVAYTVESTDGSGNALSFTVSGSFALGEDPSTVLVDHTVPGTTPYACGWPRNNPGGESDWVLADGEVFPNLHLEDQCEEMVDLWDFRGQYLVVDASSVDCGPCQSLAEDEHSILAALEADGVDAEWITLLNTSLYETWTPADLDTRLQWIEQLGAEGPILGDRGAGNALFGSYFGDDYGFPAWAVVNPEGVVVATGVGYDPTGIEQAIRDDAGI